MLDPRVYRAGFVAVAVAVVVLAFSLRDQQGPLTSSLAPDAFNGQNSYSLTGRLASQYPNRRPGSPGDDALAGYVAQTFRGYGFAVSTGSSTARTVDGRRTIETVTGTRAGLGGGSIVVVAARDALSSPAPGQLTGTATLLELARVLAGETHQRSIVLASTSASAGGAGAIQLARQLGGVDAVLVLGDLGAARVREPVVVPWSETQRVAPPELRNTVATALGSQAQIAAGGTSLAGQLLHLAFPLTLSGQGPFAARGVPAVTLSLTGERPSSAGEAVSSDRVTAMGRTVLQTINALDGATGISPATPYLLYDRKVVPGWAIKLLVLGLMAPVLLAAVDGLARARRRGHRVLRWTGWTIAAALPLVLAIGFALLARVTGWIAAVPPGPAGPGEVSLDAGGLALLAVVALAMVLSFLLLRWLSPAHAGRRAASGRRSRDAARGAGGADPGGRGPAVLLVLCVVVVVIWLANPFAALLLIPALHLWMWALDPEARMSSSLAATLLGVGLVPLVLAVAYYAVTLGYSPVQVVWNGLLLIAGGHLGVATAIEWSVVLGCAGSAVAVIRARAGEWQTREQEVTIRGPIGYAGPGSLGGTESALRR